ncbi:hypothetical protein U9M48_015397 [Paspalum notatum var. saurae]|uniref:Uncharacterized protein n=1 Tax=Paspalum notatum var. saurae TaxID=547442 RepID=A0AAQ3T4S6_PASNO
MILHASNAPPAKNRPVSGGNGGPQKKVKGTPHRRSLSHPRPRVHGAGGCRVAWDCWRLGVVTARGGDTARTGRGQRPGRSICSRRSRRACPRVRDPGLWPVAAPHVASHHPATCRQQPNRRWRLRLSGRVVIDDLSLTIDSEQAGQDGRRSTVRYLPRLTASPMMKEEMAMVKTKMMAARPTFQPSLHLEKSLSAATATRKACTDAHEIWSVVFISFEEDPQNPLLLGVCHIRRSSGAAAALEEVVVVEGPEHWPLVEGQHGDAGDAEQDAGELYFAMQPLQFQSLHPSQTSSTKYLKDIYTVVCMDCDSVLCC